MKIELTVNGVVRTLDLPPLVRLLDVLRGPLGLTGTKEGCGEGECGTCAVLLDGEPVNACLVPIGQCDGRMVVTVEGLAVDGAPGALGRAMAEHGGAQCGICTPGMMISAEALLVARPAPSAAEVRHALGGNLCRCTGYERIVDSVLRAAAARRGAGEVGP
ncbi:MAG: (2Fe-2S)-binding protein [Myxococcales bacterium]|nr:(2Fe-2S)-binding protein [Myxococcales bacterium]